MDNIKIALRFIGLHIISKEMVEMPIDLVIAAPIFNFDIRVESKVQAEKSLVLSVVHVSIRELNKPLKLANISTVCIFEIEDFINVVIHNEAGLYVIPDQLEALIRPVSISTTRGIIYSEFRGTYLNNAIMPIILMNTFNPIPKESLNE